MLDNVTQFNILINYTFEAKIKYYIKALKAITIYKQSPNFSPVRALLKQEVSYMFILENPTIELLKALDISDCKLRIYNDGDYLNVAIAEVDLKEKSVTLYME